jgi:hypothetical protein
MGSRGILVTIASAAVLVILLAASACNSNPHVPDEKRIDSLTIFPVTAMGSQHRNFGEALGLLLEKEGFRNLEIAENNFQPPETSDVQSVATAFGDFVATHPIATEFAAYCEFDGTPGDGVRAVRTVLVDKHGKVFRIDVQTPKDPDFARIKPSNPMSCCALVSERLRPLLTPATPAELEQEGKMAQLWARKSGTPAAEELQAMKKRAASMKRASPRSKVTVYPIRIGDRVDREAAEHLASLLNDGGLCQAQVAEESPWFEVEASSNEQRILWDMAKGIQKHIRKTAPGGDYALYADYIIRPSNGEVWAVHFVCCDPTGEFVIVDFQNNHHDDFNAISPKSVKDCNRLAATRLASYLR